MEVRLKQESTVDWSVCILVKVIDLYVENLSV